MELSSSSTAAIWLLFCKNMFLLLTIAKTETQRSTEKLLSVVLKKSHDFPLDQGQQWRALSAYLRHIPLD